MLIYLTTSLIAVGLLVYWYITRTFNYWKDRNVAFTPPVPFFGSVKEAALRKKYIGIVIKDIYEQFPNEKVVGLFRMTTPTLLVRDLDIIKDIMIKNFDQFGDRGIDFSDEGLGANLFHSHRDIWRVLRGRFSPMFTSGKLKNMFPLLTERADRIYRHIEKDIRKQSVQDVAALAKKYTITTIVACAFGIDIELDDPTIQVFEKLDKLFLVPSYTFEVDMMFPGILKKFGSSLFPAEAKQFFTDLVKTVIEQRDGKPSSRKDFMDIILEMRQEKVIRGGKIIEDTEGELELTDDIIAAQAFVFYVGGFETSSTTVGFLLYELSQNPHVQDKLIAEIDEYNKKHGGVLEFDDLMTLPYLSMVFDETLRKYPIVEPLQRRAFADYKVPGTDVVIEKGQIVYFSGLGVHYDEKHYPNPEVFDPERFSAENSRNRHPCAYLPFGVGPRNCIGMRFGKLQSRLIIVKLLSNFRVEPTMDTPSKMSFESKWFLLKAKKSIRLNIVPRN